MGSTLVALHAHQPHPGSLALVAGLAAQAAVAEHVPAPLVALLKWPNDVMVGGAKLAGILLERVGEHVVVGIGVNLSRAPEIAGRETIALSRFGPAPERDTFAASLAAHFTAELERWRSFGLAALVQRWQAGAHTIGTELSVTTPGEGVLSGRFAGLDESGALRLTLADGTSRVIYAGDVALA